VVNALYIHIKQPVPLLCGKVLNKAGDADARIADQQVYGADFLRGGVDRIAVGHVTANRGRAGFGLYQGGGFVLFFIEKVYLVPSGSEQFYSGGTNTAAAAGDQYG